MAWSDLVNSIMWQIFRRLRAENVSNGPMEPHPCDKKRVHEVGCSCPCRHNFRLVLEETTGLSVAEARHAEMFLLQNHSCCSRHRQNLVLERTFQPKRSLLIPLHPSEPPLKRFKWC